MTGQEIITLFRAIIDEDSLDADYELDLLNTAKDALEGDREWEFLKKLDITTFDWIGSDTYLTSHTLPTDFMSPVTI